MPSQRENGVTLDSCPVEAFTCAGRGGDFLCVRYMLTAGSNAKTFSPSFCGYESECTSSSFKRLVSGAQLLRSLEWLIQPLVRVCSYPAPPLWLFECLQRCLGNRIQISEQISQPLFSDLCVIESSGVQTVFFLDLWWKRHTIFIHFSHYFNTDFQYLGTAAASFMTLQDTKFLQNLSV